MLTGHWNECPINYWFVHHSHSLNAMSLYVRCKMTPPWIWAVLYIIFFFFFCMACRRKKEQNKWILKSVLTLYAWCIIEIRAFCTASAMCISVKYKVHAVQYVEFSSSEINKYANYKRCQSTKETSANHRKK